VIDPGPLTHQGFSSIVQRIFFNCNPEKRNAFEAKKKLDPVVWFRAYIHLIKMKFKNYALVFACI
jgi:hypothetical protein